VPRPKAAPDTALEVVADRGYHQTATGGEHVTYERLRAMGTNGFQEPATGFEDGRIVGTKRLHTDGSATSLATKWRGLQAPGSSG